MYQEDCDHKENSKVISQLQVENKPGFSKKPGL